MKTENEKIRDKAMKIEKGGKRAVRGGHREKGRGRKRREERELV